MRRRIITLALGAILVFSVTLSPPAAAHQKANHHHAAATTDWHLDGKNMYCWNGWEAIKQYVTIKVTIDPTSLTGLVGHPLRLRVRNLDGYVASKWFTIPDKAEHTYVFKTAYYNSDYMESWIDYPDGSGWNGWDETWPGTYHEYWGYCRYNP